MLAIFLSLKLCVYALQLVLQVPGEGCSAIVFEFHYILDSEWNTCLVYELHSGERSQSIESWALDEW